MIHLDFKQNSCEWRKWRLEGLGASDAPIILGKSPWKTRSRLLMEKIKFKEIEPATSFAQKRGHDLEPVARKIFEAKYDIKMPPTCGQHEKDAFMLASFDGYNSEMKSALEIKCPGKRDHSKALSGQIPEKYIPQLNHQAYVGDLKKIYYCSFDGRENVVVEFFPDQNELRKLVENLRGFWQDILTYRAGNHLLQQF